MAENDSNSGSSPMQLLNSVTENTISKPMPIVRSKPQIRKAAPQCYEACLKDFNYSIIEVKRNRFFHNAHRMIWKSSADELSACERSWFLQAGVLATFVLSFLAGSVKSKETQVSFIRDVAPVLVERCQHCHGRNDAQNGYRVDTYRMLMVAGESGSAPISPGKLKESEVFRRITSDDEDERMPQDGEPLNDAQIDSIRRWIEQRALFDGADEFDAISAQLATIGNNRAPLSYRRPVPVIAVGFLPDGNAILAAGFRELTIWNSSDGELIRRVGTVARIYDLKFSPDEALLAVGGGVPGISGEVRLLQLPDFAEERVLGRNADTVLCVAFSPDGRRIVVGSADRSLRVFDVLSGGELAAIESHSDWITAVAWSPDGKSIAAGCRDATLRIINAETGELRTTFRDQDHPVNSVAFSADSKKAFGGGGKTVQMWDVTDGGEGTTLFAHDDEVSRIVVVSDQLFSASADRTAKQYDIANRKAIRSFGGHSDSVISLAIDLRQQKLLTGCSNGEVRLWDLENGRELIRFVAAPGLATSFTAR